ncbi:Crp/Fnr family transcriptional regulator [Granulicella tundricola]|uniref:Putative transcriptional regulator, Crp/Fnr family n=1 Tax=Granulicella tundricola (strain ATCC BAA-1859 / DSM 23138 / MP5ACTX9) TaxID=1198114 RepID=E8X1A6_GRATM|nr:Crp/Fnr family transcriptional regulator [Granulicella tundricola]ADW69060.1 putative transcriptional regulator, Crp/Fnr family [Granulicella tundricola MP5ACTX9]
MQDKSLLGNAPAFVPIESDLLDGFLSSLPQHLLAPGEMLHQQDSLPPFVFLIRRGIVKMTYATEDGVESMIGLRSVGWLGGAAHVITGTLSTSTVHALTACCITRIDAELFKSVIQTDAQLAHKVMCSLARELVTTRELVKQVMANSAQSRLLTYLNESRSESQGWKCADIKSVLSQAEVAQLLGITPEHLSRIKHSEPKPRLLNGTS